MARSANLQWLVQVDTTPTATPTLVEIGGLESLDFSFEEETKQGYFNNDNGTGYSDVTAGRLTVSVSGKRVDGDAGQDYISGLAGSWGASRKNTLTLTHSVTGDIYSIPCSIELGATTGGSMEELEAFECTFHSDGAWTYTDSV